MIHPLRSERTARYRSSSVSRRARIRGLGNHRVERRELHWDLVEELGVLRHHARLFAQTALAAKQVVAQVYLQVVEAEHAHVAGESIHPDSGAGLGGQQVEQFVGVVEGTLAVDRHLGPERVGDLEQRPFEVGRELAGVAPSRPARHPIALDQHHPAPGPPEREECRRDARDPGADDRDVGGRVGIERSWRTVGSELGDPRRPVRLVRVGRTRHRSNGRCHASAI